MCECWHVSAKATPSKMGKHQPDLSLHWKVAHALKMDPFSPQSCLELMDASAGHHSSPVKIYIFSCPATPTPLKVPPAPRSMLTSRVSRHPEPPPPAVLTAVSCIPAAEHLKNDRNGLLGQLKESWSWFSLGAINKRAAWNKQSGWQAANDGLNFKPLTWGQVN